MALANLSTLIIPGQTSAPKGRPACREAAALHLSPFEGMWRKDKRKRQKLSKQHAIRLIENIARAYNTNLYLERHAPRSADVLDRIRKLKKATDGLARELNTLGNLSARIIYGEALARCKRSKSRQRLFEAANLFGLMAEGRSTSPWSRQVSALTTALGLLSVELTTDWEKRGYAVKDKGSKRNHFTETEGTAKWRFLTDALHVYDIFKPGQATGTEGGALHQFVNEIFEYATDKEANEGLLRPLRNLIKPTREENRITALNQQLLEELENLAPGKTIDQMSDAQLSKQSELLEKLWQNSQRRAELSRITWPHAPLPGP